jgi:hypothetical protein
VTTTIDPPELLMAPSRGTYTDSAFSTIEGAGQRWCRDGTSGNGGQVRSPISSIEDRGARPEVESCPQNGAGECGLCGPLHCFAAGAAAR